MEKQGAAFRKVYSANGPAERGDPPMRVPPGDPLLMALMREHGTPPAAEATNGTATQGGERGRRQ